MIIAVVCVRYVLLPFIGIGVVKAASSLGFLPSDPLYHYVLMIQFALPPCSLPFTHCMVNNLHVDLVLIKPYWFTTEESTVVLVAGLAKRIPDLLTSGLIHELGSPPCNSPLQSSLQRLRSAHKPLFYKQCKKSYTRGFYLLVKIK